MKLFQSFLLFILLFIQSAVAQEIGIQNNNPPSLRWRQINTPSFRILFPGGFEKEAQRVANTMEHIREAEERSMGVKPRRISILLQNQTSVSNGFVTLAPRRSEFFTMPPQDNNHAGTNDWLNLLAVHEYRHIVQYQRSIVGFNKLVYYAFGQQALSLLAFTAAPQWFWEGDAVAVETAVTGSGRGRIPHFNLLLRTNLLEGRTFNYSKQYLRSYKHNISDHYVLGYHMISYLRRKTNDAAIWEKVVRRTWSAPFIPFAFSRSIRKESGLRVERLYREMADSLRTEWQLQTDTVGKSTFQPVFNRTSRAYTDYRYPQLLADGSVVVMKSGIGDIPQLIQFKDGKQQSKYVVGPWNDSGMLSSANEKVVWNEFRYDPRWRMKTYTIIKTFDFETGKSRVLSRKSRYASVAISPDGSKVAAVESTVGYECRLVVIDWATRGVLKVFENPDQQFISMPRWANDGQSIVTLRLSSAGKVISRFDLASGEVSDLATVGNENVAHPVLHNNYLFYNSPYSGIDNIYVLDISSGNKFQITSSKLGSYNPSVSGDGKWIYYNEQTKNGMDVARTALEPSLWIPLERVGQPKENLFSHLVEQEGHPDLLKGVPTNDYPVRPYRKWKGVVNPHSWGPFFSSNTTTADVGISSRDLLGTTVLNAGYSFDINERTGLYKAGLSYQGLYPILDCEVTHGNRELLTGANDLDVKFSWKETSMSGAVRLPFLLTRSKFLTSLTLKNAVGLTQVSQFENRVSQGSVLISRGNTRQIRLNNNQAYIFAEQVSNGFLLYNAASVTFAYYLRMSRRDINPRWGVQIDLEHYSTPYGGDFNGSLSVARSVLYIPGILKHHSLMLRGNYQDGSGGFETNRYAFRNRIFKPRGFAYPRDTQFISLSANYILPLWYPDIAVGPLVNFQRVRANLFYDYGDAKGNSYVYLLNDNNRPVLTGKTDRVYQSVGAEIKFDINVMRLLPQLDIGFRVTYGLSHKENSMFEFLLGTLNL